MIWRGASFKSARTMPLAGGRRKPKLFASWVVSLTMAIMRTLVVAALASVVKSEDQCFSGHFTINVDAWDAGYTDALAAAIAALAGDDVMAGDVTAVATEGGTAAPGSCATAWAARPTTAPSATTAAPAATTAMPSDGPGRLLEGVFAEESDDIFAEESWIESEAADTPAARQLQTTNAPTTTVAGGATTVAAAAAGTVHVAYTIIADAAVVEAAQTAVGAVTAAAMQTQVEASFTEARASNAELPEIDVTSATVVTAGAAPAARPAPAPAPAPDTTSDALKVLPLFSLIIAGFLA